jgi:hypothetical protein
MAQPVGQNKIILYLIIVLGFIAGYYYDTSFNIPGPVPLPASIVQREKGADALAPFKDLKIDFSILDNNRYKKLQVYGEQPVNPGQTGKRNLFAP